MLLSVLASINLSTNVIKLAHARLDALGVRDSADGGLVGSHDGKDLSKDLYREHKDRKEYRDRKEHKDRQAVRPQRPPWHNLRLAPNRLWLAAMVVFIIANLANFASFAFAAQSLLAALGSIQFVSNVVFARLVNKERITRQTVIGTLVIVGGCIVLVMFGSHDSPAYTVDDLLDLYGNPGYIVYLCVGATVAVTSYAAFWWIKRKRGQRNLALYVLFSALVGTQSVLYGKSLSLLFRAALDGTNVAAHWYSWICLVAFLAAAVYWVRRFNKGLQLFEVMTSMPAMQVGWIIFSLVSGGLYFEEFSGFGGLQWGMFSLGVVGVIAGVVCICVGAGRGAGFFQGQAARRVSTMYDAVGVQDGEEKEGKEGEGRRCITAYCHVECTDLERGVDVAGNRRNRTI